MLGNSIEKIDGVNQLVDIKKFHLDRIISLFDFDYISKRLKKMKLRIFVDSMHGSAANCMAEIFASNDLEVITEIRRDADPFFGGKPPEPLLDYADDLSSRRATVAGNPSGQSVLGNPESINDRECSLCRCECEVELTVVSAGRRFTGSNSPTPYVGRRFKIGQGIKIVFKMF